MDLEVVEALQISSHSVQFLIVGGLDLVQGLGHFALPEFAVLSSGVSVSESSQFLHFLVELRERERYNDVELWRQCVYYK